VPYRKADIRPYRDSDEPLLFSLARMAFGDRPGWSDRRTLTVLERDTVFVAEVDADPAGYVALDPRERRVQIDQLLVSPQHEAEGVGRQLVQYAEGYAIWRGARAVSVVVEGDNRRAVAFYRRYGFAPAAFDLLELVLPQP
jgi:ribosomal protein S18 acetylase RimI-like enzyme